MKCLIVKEKWLELILAGKKSWEIRGSNTRIRGKIGLIQSGSGKIFGEAELVDSIPLTKELLKKNFSKHRIPLEKLDYLKYKKPFAWILRNPKEYKTPKAYKHPQGAVIWVNV